MDRLTVAKKSASLQATLALPRYQEPGQRGLGWLKL